MKKIGIECENLEDPGSRWGVGRITLSLLQEYAANPEWQKKYELYLYFKKRIPDDEVLKNPVFVKQVLGFPSFNVFYHILMPLRAMADRVDWMFFPAYQLPPLYRGRSVVLLTHDVYYEYKSGNLPFRYRLAYRLFTNWAARFATKILAISETSKKELVKLYGIEPERIFVNYLGVDASPFFAQGFEGRQTKDNYLLFVGQMFPRRHARETILAFKKIASGFKDLKLIMVGKDKYPPSPRLRRAGSPSIIGELVKKVNGELGGERIMHYDYIEKREEVERLYAGAKALVYVSDREAFGLPPMEALSFGIPPVIMDNELGHELFGARPEETQSLFGDYAFYSKSGEVNDIADAIKRALTDKPKIQKIKNSGPEFVKKYNWKDFADRFFENLM